MKSKAVLVLIGLGAVVALVSVAGILELGSSSKGPDPTVTPVNTVTTSTSTSTTTKNTTSKPPAPLTFKMVTEGLPIGGEWRGIPAVADLDGNGAPDIVCSVRKGDGLYILLGDGNGGFREAMEGIPRNLGYGGSAIADFNGDGRPDIVFSTHGTPVQVFLAKEDGTWSRAQTGLANSDIMTDVDAGDIDGDGDMDIVALAWSEGALQLFRNNGDATFTTVPLFPEDRRIFGKELKLDDVDGDGKLDIVATYYGPKVFLGDGKGGFTSCSKGLPVPLTGGVFQGLDTADLDGDGKKELVVVSMAIAEERLTGLGVFQLGSDGVWAERSEGLPRGDHYNAVRFADLDRDGMVDIVASGSQRKVEIFLGRPGMSWATGFTVPESSKRAVVEVADFNRDGLPDILEIYAFRPGGVRIWLQQPKKVATPAAAPGS
jgi:hypothetical protein